MMDNLPYKYQVKAIKPAANYLFEENDTARKLINRDTQKFHTILAKIIFLWKRVHPDILTGVPFLTTRAREPYEDGDKKMGRILKYLSNTRDVVLTLEYDSTGMVKWWADVAFAVQNDMKNHTGRMISMGRGVLYSASN